MYFGNEGRKGGTTISLFTWRQLVGKQKETAVRRQSRGTTRLEWRRGKAPSHTHTLGEEFQKRACVCVCVCVYNVKLLLPPSGAGGAPDLAAERHVSRLVSRSLLYFRNGRARTGGGAFCVFVCKRPQQTTPPPGIVQSKRHGPLFSSLPSHPLPSIPSPNAVRIQTSAAAAAAATDECPFFVFFSRSRLSVPRVPRHCHSLALRPAAFRHDDFLLSTTNIINCFFFYFFFSLRDQLDKIIARKNKQVPLEQQQQQQQDKRHTQSDNAAAAPVVLQHVEIGIKKRKNWTTK